MYDPPSYDELELYEFFQIARWAGVPVWKLMKQPTSVIEGYRHAMEVENELHQEIAKKLR